MTHLSLFSSVSKSIFFVFCLSLCAFAQTTELSGRVTDASSAAVANARVTLRARASNGVTTTQTDAQGAYRFARVLRGDYVLTVEARGFARFVQTLDAANASKQDITLSVASVSDAVVVTDWGEMRIATFNCNSIRSRMETVLGTRAIRWASRSGAFPGAWVSQRRAWGSQAGVACRARAATSS